METDLRGDRSLPEPSGRETNGRRAPAILHHGAAQDSACLRNDHADHPLSGDSPIPHPRFVKTMACPDPRAADRADPRMQKSEFRNPPSRQSGTRQASSVIRHPPSANGGRLFNLPRRPAAHGCQFFKTSSLCLCCAHPGAVAAPDAGAAGGEELKTKD